MNGPKIYFTIPILGGIPITQTAASSFAVMLILCIAGIVLGRNLQKRPGRRQVLVEKGVSMLYGMVEDTMGKHNTYWTPYIGALFLSSLFGTLIGMTGILRSATADLSTTVTWALMTSVICWGCSIKQNGFLDRLEQEMLQHGKSDEHIAEGEQRSPWVDADKTFKACHGSSPPFVSDLLRK